MIRFLMLIFLLLCSSCVQIGGDRPASHHYLLQSMDSETTSLSSKSLNIELKIIDFPGYLDQKNILTYNQDNSVNIASSARWAEPLQDNLMRILRKNLYILLPEALISVSPWEQTPPGATQVKLLINNFTGKLGNEVDIDLNWLAEKEGRTVDRGHFVYRHPLGSGHSDLAFELSQGIEVFSHMIAEKLMSY